jgi:hypothetical protein
MLLFAFGFAWMMIYTERWELWRNKKRTLVCLGMVILPALIVYPLFLPWAQSRNLSPSEWQPQTVPQWIEWLLDRHEAKEAFVIQGFEDQLLNYGDTIINDYTLAIPILAIIGVFFWMRRQPAFGGFILISFGLQGLLAANWRDNDTLFTYFLPSFMLIAYAAGYGANVVWDGLRNILQKYEKPSPKILKSVIGSMVIFVMLVLPIYQYNHTYELRYMESISGYSLVGEQTEAGVSTGKWRTTLKAGDMGDRLASGMDLLPPNAVLIADWEQVTIFWYYQKVENRRTDIEIVYPIEKLRDYENSDRPICVSRTINIAEVSSLPMEAWHPTSYDALTCLNRAPQFELLPRMTPIGRSLSIHDTQQPQIELAGYWIKETNFAVGRWMPMVLSWRALADLDENYSISLRVLDENWNLIAQWDTQFPVTGMYPTSYWSEGEVVQDYHELDIPLDMKAGRYLWGVVVYRIRPDGLFENLVSFKDDGSMDEFIFGGTFEVFPRE